MPRSTLILNKAITSQLQEQSWYKIQLKDTAKGEKTSTKVFIYDEIGRWGTDSNTFLQELMEIDTDIIELHINSPGGEVFHGIAIYNALKAHPSDVHVIVDSLAASAASFIAQAGDIVFMTRNATMMVHDASGMCWGTAAELMKWAGILDKISDNVADIYANSAGGTQEEWRAFMKEEVWYSAKEAVTAGLATEVLDYDDKDADEEAENKWDMSAFVYKGRADAPPPKELYDRAIFNMKNFPKASKEVTVTQPTQPDPVTQAAPVAAPAATQPTATATQPAPVGEPAPATPATLSATTPEVVTVAPSTVSTNVTFNVNGAPVTDAVAIQRHITALETSATESKFAARSEFVKSLAARNMISVVTLDKTQEFVKSLSDDQYTAWTAQYTEGTALPLFGNYGAGTGGQPTQGNQQNTVADEIKTLEEIVLHNKRGGMSESTLKQTSSYLKLQELKSAQALQNGNGNPVHV